MDKYIGLRVNRKAPSVTIAVVGLRISKVVFARASARKADTTIAIETRMDSVPNHSAGFCGRNWVGDTK